MSDIHATDDSQDSWLSINGAETPLQSPIESLLDFIDENDIKADYLVCCGDIGNKALPAGITYGWDQVHKIANKLNALVVATAGNHDVDSRFQHNSFDAKGHLQSLSPTFPLGKDELNDRYWSRNYVIFSDSKVRFIVLNSAAYHGYASDPENPEYLHGRLAEKTAESMKRELYSMKDNAPVNIALCHHHPHQHGDLVADSDYSVMQDGHRLIDILNEYARSRWLVLHGHKHHPRLCYAAGSSNSPIVFGAGSFSAKLDAVVSQRARNQFYLLTFDINEQKELDLDIAGTFESFDWTTSVGWSSAGMRSGLPAQGGFGYTLHRKRDAQAVFDAIKSSSGTYVTWSDILQMYPQYKYLLPTDQERLHSTLQDDFHVRILLDRNTLDIQLWLEQTS